MGYARLQLRGERPQSCRAPSIPHTSQPAAPAVKMWRTIRGEHGPMRFVGLALISALAASEATWGCQSAPPSPGTSEAPSLAAASRKEDPAAQAEATSAPLSAAAGAAEAASRVTRSVLPGDNPSKGLLLAAGDPRLNGEHPGEERLLHDPLIGDTLIGDGEPMDDVDDAASGVAAPAPGNPPGDPGSASEDVAQRDPDQAGAPVEPPSLPAPAPRLSGGSTASGAGQAEPRGTALENQQR
jgi:hypothetical protein